MKKHRHSPAVQSKCRNILYAIHRSLGPPPPGARAKQGNAWDYWDAQRAAKQEERRHVD